jgi:hypothetical protein
MDQQQNAMLLDQNLLIVLSMLNRPFDPKYVIDGWHETSWIKWRNIFIDIQNRRSTGKQLPIASISRALDFDGIISGEILEKSSEIGNLIRTLMTPNRITIV